MLVFSQTGVKSTVDTVKKVPKAPREFPAPAKSTPSGATKRPTLQPATTATKKFRMSSFKDISLAEAGKYGSLNEFAFFDKVQMTRNTSGRRKISMICFNGHITELSLSL